MPTSPIVVQPLNNEALVRSLSQLGEGLGMYLARKGLGQQQTGVMQGSILGDTMGGMNAAPGTAPTQPGVIESKAGQREQTTRQAAFQPSPAQPAGDVSFPNVAPQQASLTQESMRPLAPPPALKLPTFQEISDFKSKLIAQGYEPRLVDARVQAEIDNIKERYAAAQKGYASQEDYRKTRQLENERFDNASMPFLQAKYKTMSAEQYNVWKGIARSFENEASDEARIAKTDQLYSAMIHDPLQGFDKTGPALPYFSLKQPQEIENRLEDARSMIQDHLASIDRRTDIPDQVRGEVKNYLRNAYRTSLVTKDWGNAQAAYATSNLSDSFKKAVSTAPAEQESFAMRGTRELLGSAVVAPAKIRDKEVYKLANSLTSMKPDDSLILAREYALKNNYTDAEFNRAIDLAVNSQKLQLSDFQRGDRNNLSIPRRLDLNSIMEGKRSVFDYYKAKK